MKGKKQMISKEKRQIIMCFVMMIVLIVCSFSDVLIKSGEAYGYTEKVGTVTASSLNVRSGPGTTYGVIGSVSKNQEVRIIGQANASDGKIWYQIKYKGSFGYVSSSYITNIKDAVDIEYVYDEAFEKYLTEQKFPESYKDGLRILHTKYPKWVFVADHLNFDWETAVTNQNYGGRALISGTSISSWKSIETDGYNWDTGVWYTHWDSGNWVKASREIVAYYMDPRNFFDEDYIWMFEMLSYDKKLHNIDALENILDGTFMDKDTNYVVNDATGDKSTYSEILMIAAEVSGVSPYYLASSILIEMGNKGASDSISGTLKGYEGYYNYYNWKAYKTSTGSAIQNGLKYAMTENDTYWLPWNTRYKAIIGGAIMFANGYIDIGQDTLYYKRFDYILNPNAYTHQYMTNIQGHASEAKKTSEAYSDELKKNSSIVFKIPVFKNMPDAAVPIPTGDGSPNNVLKTLTVTGQSLTPTFSKFTTSYSMVVDNDVTSVNVNATTMLSSAKLTGTGTYQLKEGVNTIKLNVTAESGAVRTYTIEIVRLSADTGGEGESGSSSGGSGSTTPTPPTEKPENPSFVVDTSLVRNDATGNITGIEPGSTVDDIRKAFTITGGSVTIKDKNGTAKTDGAVGTGDKIVVANTSGTESYTYTVIIYGDVNGDGIVGSIDVLMLRKYIFGTYALENEYLLAGDSFRDGDGITSKDVLAIRKYIFGTLDINQK